MRPELSLALRHRLAARDFEFIVVLGQTGSGKSRLALDLASRLGGEIVNCDSRQIYADFPIITAQPDQDDLAACPHHLYGFLATPVRMTAGSFAELARAKLDQLKNSRRLPILVGGTGLYLRALTDGLADIPTIPAEVRAGLLNDLDRLGAEALHARLAALDPDYAARTHPNNTRHVLRALEVSLHTGRPFTWWHNRPVAESAQKPLLLGLSLDKDRSEEILRQRIEAMLGQGALREAALAWEKCPDIHAPGWSGIGCAELAAWLSGHIGLDQALADWLKNTRSYAKRQATWFKTNQDIVWL